MIAFGRRMSPAILIIAGVLLFFSGLCFASLALHAVGVPGALAALAARLETVAADYGFEREKRRWSGHLTIGRVGDQPVAGKTRQALYAARDREFGVSRIESITLYRSHLGPDGSSYEALATFLFQAR